MKDSYTVMPQETADIYERLNKKSILAPFVLIGGTALSLHLGHRVSEDLDFITHLPGLPRSVITALIDDLKNEGFGVRQSDEHKAHDEFLNAGMDLHDHNQNLIIDNKVKITFFTADSTHRNVLAPASKNADRFRIATMEEIRGLKALVATSRSTSRDWFDLYILSKEHGFGLPQWKEVYQKAGLSDYHFENAVNRICSGKLPSDDPAFQSLLPESPNVEEISAHFQKLRNDYESGLGKKKLST
ncbi:MAG: nucleotidyl transferase AbiEii/AbiGii toxin family protein [Chthoniobacterales bacterium]